MKPEEIEEMMIQAAADVKAQKEIFFQVSENVIIARRALDAAKMTAFQLGKIDGKNEQAREGQYMTICEEQYKTLFFAESEERRARYALEQFALTLELASKLLRIAEIGSRQWNG